MVVPRHPPMVRANLDAAPVGCVDSSASPSSTPRRRRSSAATYSRNTLATPLDTGLHEQAGRGCNGSPQLPATGHIRVGESANSRKLAVFLCPRTHTIAHTSFLCEILRSLLRPPRHGGGVVCHPITSPLRPFPTSGNDLLAPGYVLCFLPHGEVCADLIGPVRWGYAARPGGWGVRKVLWCVVCAQELAPQPLRG